MDKMDFAKYYNATSVLNDLLKEKDKLSSYPENPFEGIYVCMDTHDFWICRILKGYNSEYEKDENSYLVERNKIDKYYLLEFIQQDEEDKLEISNRAIRDNVIDTFEVKDLIKYVIMYDDNEGLSNWDFVQCDDIEECLKVIDGGWGIVELSA